MASLNKPVKGKAKTHEGAPASVVNPKMELERALMTCLLWEDSFYEDGTSVVDRITNLVPQVKPEDAFALAVKARSEMNIRHAPLLIARAMAKLPSHRGLVAKLLPEIIKRPDELTEFLAIYWKNGREKVSAQVKKGLAKAFKKFNEYSLAKYNKDGAVKLRDVLFISHPKPENDDQQALWDRLVKGEMATPDTWEVELSAKGNSKEVWERLLKEGKVGGMALIRNLRNMQEQKVDKALIKAALTGMKTDRILPFRFLASARYAPDFEPELESAMLKSLEGYDKMAGNTAVVVDVSGSMVAALSAKSEMLRTDAAYGLAILAREMFSEVDCFTFSNAAVKIPPRKGFALRDAMEQSQQHGGTNLGAAVKAIVAHAKYDRVIVVTDEQSADAVPGFDGKGYIINVAPYKNGVGYGQWTHINGWSDAVLNFIRMLEATNNL